jgi:hypothetical protein
MSLSDAPPPPAPPEYPPPQFPVVFADGVSSTAWGRGTVKFYLYRSDPEISARGPSKDTAFAQVVMPTRGFAAMYYFFQKTMETLQAQGEVTEAMMEDIRQSWERGHAG